MLGQRLIQKSRNGFFPKTQRRFSHENRDSSSKKWNTAPLALAGCLGGTLVVGYLMQQSVNADDEKPQNQRWKSNSYNLDPYHDQKYPKFPEPYELPNGLVLKQVQVLFRHGERAPLWVPIGDNVGEWYCDNEDGNGTGPCYAGQLTARGKRQLFQLGANLRRIYIDQLHFIQPNLVSDEIRLECTDVPRTKQSLFNVIQALYPPNTRTNQPSVFIRPNNKEILYPDDTQCARLREMYIEYRQSPEYKKGSAEAHAIKEHIKPIMELKDKQGRHPTLSALFDYLMCLRETGLPLPHGITHEMYDEVAKLNTRHWWSPFATNEEIARLGVGRMLEELTNKMQNNISAKDKTKVIVYSGHDGTLAPLLGALKVYDNKWPHYSSVVMLELLQKQNTEEYFVRLIYNGKTLHFPGYRDVIPFNTFKSQIQHLIPKDFEQECKPKNK